MSILQPLTVFVKPLADLVTTWIKGRTLRQQADAAEAAQRLAQTGKWEELMAQASALSWKDEYWTIVLSIPAIMSFVPKLAPYVGEGFAVLSGAPVWYTTLLVLAVSASFGVQVRNKWKRPSQVQEIVNESPAKTETSDIVDKLKGK